MKFLLPFLLELLHTYFTSRKMKRSNSTFFANIYFGDKNLNKNVVYIISGRAVSAKLCVTRSVQVCILNISGIYRNFSWRSEENFLHWKILGEGIFRFFFSKALNFLCDTKDNSLNPALGNQKFKANPSTRLLNI